MNIVDPAGESRLTPIEPALRSGLQDRMVGILINGKEYSDEVLERLTATLTNAVAVRGVKYWDKGWPVQPAPFLDEIAREVEVVITGVGH